MNLKNLIPVLFGSPRVKHVSGQTFADILNKIDRSRSFVSVDGFVRKATSKDVILFSESPQTKSWTPISVKRIAELEHLGQEMAQDGACERVRIIL